MTIASDEPSVSPPDPSSRGSPEAHPARATVAPTATAARATSRPFPVRNISFPSMMGSAHGRAGPGRAGAEVRGGATDPDALGHHESFEQCEGAVEHEGKGD